MLLNRKTGQTVGTNNINVADLLRKYGLVIALAVLVIILSVVTNTFFTAQNLFNVVRQISINGIIALGMTFVILTGGIDLSVGSLVAIAGVVAGSILNVNPDYAWIAFIAGILASSVFGMITGGMVVKFDIPPFIATLAMMTIARGVALVYSNGRPYILASDTFKAFGQGYIGPIPIPVVVLILMAVVTAVILTNTRFGRYVYAVGGNEKAARASGVKIGKTKFFVYTISGVLSGLAGVILASRINSGQPAIGTGYELDAIAAVVIGGTSLVGGEGTILGTILGFFIIGIINNGLDLLNVSSYYQQIVKGLIIVGAVILDQKTKKYSK